MRKIALAGVNALNEVQKLGKNVIKFTDEKNYFGITVHQNDLKMITPHGVYYLKKSATQNIFAGPCKGRRVEVTIRKIVGEVRFW